MGTPKISAQKNSSILTWLLLFVLIPFSYYLFVWDAHTRQLVDFSIYWEAAQLLKQGAPLYGDSITVLNRWQQPTAGYYLYPPLLAWALAKLKFANMAEAQYWWCTLAWFSIIIAAACLASLIRAPFPQWNARVRFTACLFLCVCFEPVYSGISDGQVAAILLMLLSAAFALAQHNKFGFAGICIGIAAGIKITPALLLLTFLPYRHYRGIAGFTFGILASFAVVALDSQARYTLNQFLDYLLALSADERHRDFPFNYAFDKAILLPFGLELERSLRWLVKALVVSSCFLCLFRIRPDKVPFSTTLAIMCCLMMLGSPIMWFHHLTWALPPLIVLLSRVPEQPTMRIKHLTLSIGLFFALSQTHLLHYWIFSHQPDLMRFSTMLPGLLIVTIAVFLWRYRERSVTAH